MPYAIVLHICAIQIQSAVRGYFTRRFLRLLQPQWPAKACNQVDPITQEVFSTQWTMHICENNQLFQFSIATLLCQFPYLFHTNPFTRVPLHITHIKQRIFRMHQLNRLPVIQPLLAQLDWPYMQTQMSLSRVPSNEKKRRLLFPNRKRKCVRK